ncbi:DNA/RNA-binding protein KIN17-like [Ptychodera flava]|uniref:DNA/RNA-binding protein KIN17-like n=1 Tax=Ptychodera flava TaxID=63121 RepID=UPI00396A5194
MGKHDFLTPKAIANRIKAKGLQKLRWYCQMCQKQCRDENGFKCHTMSESHQRQLLLFAENPDKYLDAYSEEFLDDFMELLRRRFGTRRVHCNVVYNEYIQHKEHIHMNSTQWETLTDFVKWLGREGKVKVDHTEKGWFITYIDKDPETIRKQEALAKKEKMEMDDEERIMKFIEKQIDKVKEAEGEKEEAVYTELQRDNDEDKVSFSLSIGSKGEASKSSREGDSSSRPSTSSTSKASKPKILPTVNPLKPTVTKKKEGTSSSKDRKRKSALDEIMEEEESKKAKFQRTDYWLAEGIVVKVTTARLGDRYHKKKAVIKEVHDKYTAIVKMLDSGDKLKLDQAHVETVIPAQGKLVLVLNGAYRNSKARLLSLDEKRFCVSIKLETGPQKGRLVDGVQYEDISKLADQTL